MAQRFINPNPQFVDSAGNPYSGAKVFFYQSGTSTKLDTYTDAALSVANSNPVVLNSAGYSATAIFLQNQDYKVVLAPSTDSDPPTSPIWTADPVRGSDFVNFSIRRVGSGSPTGVVAGTAGSSGVLPTEWWDYTGGILYVCTTTGDAATAVWTALNAAAATPVVNAPQGYLTPTSGTPVITGDSSAATSIYYTPDKGNLVPIYNGSRFVPTEFAEITLSLVASHALSSIYDVFVFSNSGVLTLVTGPAWSTATAGSGARGTGAGTTQISRLNGHWVNTVSMTGRNGSTTYSIGANLATYLGSIFMDGTNGQISCHRTFGQNRKWGIWNAYNRKPILLKVGDATGSWSYTTATIRQSNGATGNKATVFMGLQEEIITADFVQRIADGGGVISVGIGFDSTTAYSGFAYLAPGASLTHHAHARHTNVPILGISNINCLELGNAAGGTFNGGEDDMQMIVQYMG